MALLIVQDTDHHEHKSLHNRVKRTGTGTTQGRLSRELCRLQAPGPRSREEAWEVSRALLLALLQATGHSRMESTDPLGAGLCPTVRLPELVDDVSLLDPQWSSEEKKMIA